MKKQVLIVGTGMMGRGIAAVSSLAGNQTVLIHFDKDKAALGVNAAIEHILELKENGLATEEQAKNAIQSLSCSDNLEEFVSSADMIIEAIVEDLAAKQVLFQKLDSLFPVHVPLMSTTSGIRITDISQLTVHPERCITAHFWFPAHLIPLVEVVVGDHTDPNLGEEIKLELTSWGKAAVLVKRDLPGQLANRIHQAIIREAVNIVEIGLASPEDVDTAIKMGMGIRFPAWGPLEHVDAVGMDLCTTVQNTVLPEISTSQTALPMMANLLKSGKLGYKTGEGFYNWKIKSMEELAKKRNAFVIHALKFLNSYGK